MQLFEEVKCDICDQNIFEEIYKSTQYSHTFGKINIRLVSCKNCGFIYQNPQLTTNALDKHYSNNSSGSVYKEFKNSLEYSERKEFVTEVINNFKIENICDIGGGKGEFLSYLEDYDNVQKILIEPSDAILECDSPNIIKIQSKIEDVEYSKKFKLIMFINSLEHFKSPAKVFEKISNLLEDDGFIFIEVPNTFNPYNTIGDFFSYEHMNHFTHESLFNILKRFDFCPLKLSNSKHLNTIKLIARKMNKKAILENNLGIFYEYQKNRRNLLKNLNIDEKIDKLSIYGAGEHTKYLIEQFNILDKVEYFIDSDPKKQGKYFFDKLIISPEEIKQKEIKDVLISSHDFEEEIYHKLKTMFSSLNIISIYKKY